MNRSTPKPLRILCLLHLMVLGWAITPAQAQMGDTDTRFVPDDCFFVMQFDVQKLIAYEKMGSENLEVISRYLMKQTSLDMMAMKTITIQFCKGEEEGDFSEDIFGVAITFSKPLDQKKVLKVMDMEFEEAEVDGKKYFQSKARYAPSLCFADDKTLVMGMTSALEKMVGKKSGGAKIRSLLNSADPGAEVKGAFHTNEMYETFLSEIAGGIPFSPFNIEKVFGEAQSAVMSGNVKSSTPIFIKAECKTEEGAETLAEKIEFLVELGKTSVPLGRDAIKQQQEMLKERDLDGFEKIGAQRMEMASTALDIGEKILAATTSSSEGKSAVIKVKMMGGVKDLVPLVSGLCSAQFRAVEEMQKRFEEEQRELDRIEDEAVEIK